MTLILTEHSGRRRQVTVLRVMIDIEKGYALYVKRKSDLVYVINLSKFKKIRGVIRGK